MLFIEGKNREDKKSDLYDADKEDEIYFYGKSRSKFKVLYFASYLHKINR